MLVNILTAVAVIVIVFVVIVSLQSSDFRVTRSATIPAAPPALFAQVNDFHKWQDWSPWAKLDPNAKNTYGGPATGVGATFAWSGNMKVGAGSMTIVESRPSEVVRYELEFLKPMKCTKAAEFTFKSEGNQTVVTWIMTGQNGFMAKAFGMFMSFDKMIGSTLEEGLANLKSVVAAA